MTDSMWDVLDWRRQTAAIYRDVRSARTPAEGHALWARARARMLASHPASPVRPEQRGTFEAEFAPYDPGFRYTVPVQPDGGSVTLQVPTGTDGIVPLRRVGAVVLGDLGTLDVWWIAVYGGGFLLPVRDPTSGASTYGGGRYVLDTVKGADLGGDRRALVVDLNFSYQPSCAYDEHWACPLPGPGNTLAAPVPVGEQYVAVPAAAGAAAD